MDRRTRLHQLLLALIKKEADFELLEDDSEELSSNFTKDDSSNFSTVIKRNRKILKKYQSLIRSAVTLDSLMNSENEENFKFK